MAYHVCSPPIWEQDIYWKVGSLLENNNGMTKEEILSKLYKYPQKDVIKSLRQLKFEGSITQNQNKYKIKEKKI